jgi:hypothetical protein
VVRNLSAACPIGQARTSVHDGQVLSASMPSPYSDTGCDEIRVDRRSAKPGPLALVV